MSNDDTATQTRTTARQLDPVLADLAEVVAGIGPDDLDRPTPCTEHDVRSLREHVLGWLTSFGDGYADDDGRCPPADGVEVGEDPAAQVRAAAATLSEAIAAGAGERDLKIGDAGMPGGMALSMILWEYQMHGWDLAVAVGRGWSPAADGLEASLAFAPGMLTDEYQGVGKPFGPRVDVPDSAPPLDRLLGLSGRDPSWTPPA